MLLLFLMIGCLFHEDSNYLTKHQRTFERWCEIHSVIKNNSHIDLAEAYGVFVIHDQSEVFSESLCLLSYNYDCTISIAGLFKKTRLPFLSFLTTPFYVCDSQSQQTEQIIHFVLHQDPAELGRIKMRWNLFTTMEQKGIYIITNHESNEKTIEDSIYVDAHGIHQKYRGYTINVENDSFALNQKIITFPRINGENFLESFYILENLMYSFYHSATPEEVNYYTDMFLYTTKSFLSPESELLYERFEPLYLKGFIYALWAGDTTTRQKMQMAYERSPTFIQNTLRKALSYTETHELSPKSKTILKLTSY